MHMVAKLRLKLFCGENRYLVARVGFFSLYENVKSVENCRENVTLNLWCDLVKFRWECLIFVLEATVSCQDVY